MRHLSRKVRTIPIACATGAILALTTPTAAAETTPDTTDAVQVIGDLSQCDHGAAHTTEKLTDNTTASPGLKCAVAITDKYLDTLGRGDALAATYLTVAGATDRWRVAGTPYTCHLDGRQANATPAHHCDEQTFLVDAGRQAWLQSPELAATVLLHEAGHAVQNSAGINMGAGTHAQRQGREDWSDCMAGNGIAWAIDQGLLSDDAATDGAGLMAAIGGPEGAQHSNGQVREQSFTTGLTSDSSACDPLLDRSDRRAARMADR